MDLDWWNGPRPHFSDRTEYPTAQDVLDAVWLLQDLARDAERSGSYADAERLLLIAEEARIEYRQRSIEAYRELLPQLESVEHPGMEQGASSSEVPPSQPPTPGAR